MPKFCRVCEKPLSEFMSFGEMPIANSFINIQEKKNQYLYEMLAAFCENCFTFQLLNVPKPKQMFNENYAYLASTSKEMQEHWGDLANKITDEFNFDKKSFIVEIGSNDGIFLKHISEKKISHLGVDASSNVNEIAEAKGVNTLNAFFNSKTASDIVTNFGKADIIFSSNTMHHIEDINEVVKGMDLLLKDDGTIITEDPSLKEMIIKNSYDQIYAEHMYIWSLHSISSLFGRYKMEVYRIENNERHGGCSRYFICRKGKKKIDQTVVEYMQVEKTLKLNNIKTFLNFKKNVSNSKKILRDLLFNFKKNGKKIVGYGAPAKSTTILNYCDIDSSLIEKIFDNSSTKVGKYTPGKSMIPIEHTDSFISYKSDYTLLFAWNHKDEILKKEKNYKNKWIIPIPKIEII